MAAPLPAQGLMNIPAQWRAGDSATWTDYPFTDSDAVRFDASAYTLKYQISGVSALQLTGTASGPNWAFSLTTAASAALKAGTYWWTAQVFASAVRVTVAEGQVQVLADLTVAGANYDGRTTAEKALAQWEAAASALSVGGITKSYTIGNRQMTYHDLSMVHEMIDYWRARVNAENGGRRFMVQVSPRG